MLKTLKEINSDELVATQYIDIETQIKKLQEKKDGLKETLIRRAETLGIMEYKVDKHTIHVSWVERRILNMKKVRAKLSPQFIAKNTKITANYAIKILGRQK
jgi:heterodisulfide reductase subunit B